MNAQSTRHDLSAFAQAAEGVLSISRIYFDTSEKLAELTVASARRNLEACLAASRHTHTLTGRVASSALIMAVGAPLLARALDCSLQTCRIVTHAQREAAQVLSRQLSVAGLSPPTLPSDMGRALSPFALGLRALSNDAAARRAATVSAESQAEA